MKFNILLTGAKGFIGSYFCAKYGTKYNIKTFSFSQDNFDKLDLSNIDIVVHLSALVHQMGGSSKENYWRINVDNTKSLAIKAKTSGVSQFIFMSSIKVFGEESEHIYSENSACKPKDDYGSSKLAAEKVLQDMVADNFKVAIIRTPIVYGSGVKANIASLIKLVRVMPLLPFAKIYNKRSMVYIANLVNILDKIIICNVGGIFLAADDKPISTSAFIAKIAKYQNKKIILFYMPFLAFLIQTLKPNIYQRLYKNLVVDNTLSKEKLAINNQVSTEDGIKIMLKNEKNI